MGNAYLQMDLSTARPEVLVARLFERAIRCTREVRDLEPDPGQRAKLLRRALDIVSELRRSLDHEQGGKIAQDLEALYEFISSRLLLATVETSPVPLDEAIRVLEILVEPWQQMAATSVAAVGDDS